MSNLRRIVVFGPQGSGKGTQAELISRHCDFVYISTGDIFRREMKNKTSLGLAALAYINLGHLVPDEITNQMMAEYLALPRAKLRGFVLDGFPRNLTQLRYLLSVATITDAVAIQISDAVAISRLSGRLACHCGLSYHSEHNPPKKNNLCDDCGQLLFMREDDTPVAIKKRLAIYHSETKPVLEEFRKQGVLREIDGQQTIAKVFDDITLATNLTSCFVRELKV